MDFFNVLENVSILFLLIIIGYVVGKLNIITPSARSELTKLVLYVTMPATIILALQKPLEADKINTTLRMIAIMAGAYVVLFIVSFISTRFLKLKNNQKDVLLCANLLSNTSFMGYPIVLNLLGEDALFYAVISAGFIFEIVSWIFGTRIISRSVKNTNRNPMNAILNPGVISIAIGLLFFLTPLKIIEPINSTMRILSGATSPLAMLIIGIMLSTSNVKEALKNKVLYITVVTKLLISPLLILLILKALNFSGYQLMVPVIMLSMPSASYVAMFSDRYGNDTNLSSQAVFMTSLFSIFSIPIIANLL